METAAVVIPEKPVLDEEVMNAINMLTEAVKKFMLQKELKYLSDLHDVGSYSTEIQNSLKDDVKRLLSMTFTELPESVEGAIKDLIEDFEFDFESALSDNHYVHTKDADAESFCACED